MRATFHQITALWWLATAPLVFSPALTNSTRPDAGSVLAWGIAVVAATILMVPLALKWRCFRRWYCWTDALSERQRRAIERKDVRQYYRAAFDDGYASRVVPYLRRIAWVVGAIMATTTVAPETGTPMLDAFLVFGGWYPLGVLLVGIASLPIGSMLKRRDKRT